MQASIAPRHQRTDTGPSRNPSTKYHQCNTGVSSLQRTPTPSQWDVDGGGEIGYGELRKILSKRPAAPVAAAGGAVAALGKFKKLTGK